MAKHHSGMGREHPHPKHMEHHRKGERGVGPASNDAVDGAMAIKMDMEPRVEPRPREINKAPTMERTLGPGSRC